MWLNLNTSLCCFGGVFRQAKGRYGDGKVPSRRDDDLECVKTTADNQHGRGNDMSRVSDAAAAKIHTSPAGQLVLAECSDNRCVQHTSNGTHHTAISTTTSCSPDIVQTSIPCRNEVLSSDLMLSSKTGFYVTAVNPSQVTTASAAAAPSKESAAEETKLLAASSSNESHKQQRHALAPSYQHECKPSGAHLLQQVQQLSWLGSGAGGEHC